MKELDMRGKQCPIPVIEAKKALDMTTSEEIVSIRVDNEIAVENLKKLAKSRGVQPENEKMGENDFVVRIAGGASSKEETVEEAAAELCMQNLPASDMVVVISSDRMGEPEAELGKILIKGFIYAVSRLEKLPKTIIFYNGGASLTTEESDSLEDLKLMEEQGVEILTCGTCLKHLRLEDRLRVGAVSNMYDIVEKMTSAGRVVRP